MKRPLTAITAILITSSLTGCVFLPALATPPEPDESGYLEAVGELVPFLVETEVNREFTLISGYLHCEKAEEGMSREEILEYAYNEVGETQEGLVDAAFDHLCPHLKP